LLVGFLATQKQTFAGGFPECAEKSTALDTMQSRRIYLRIALSTENLQQLVSLLNEFSLPRAVLDFEKHSFVAWNSRFLDHTGFTENEMKSSRVEDLLTLGASPIPLFEEPVGQPVEYITCTARRPFGADPAPGYAVRSGERLGYVMLDLYDPSTSQFEQGRSVGREQERNRIAQAFHEEVSSSLIAALFLIETAKSELEEAAQRHAEAVSKASDILTEATEKIAKVIDGTDNTPQ
jgi:signal transduction histidine kinase